MAYGVPVLTGVSREVSCDLTYLIRKEFPREYHSPIPKDSPRLALHNEYLVTQRGIPFDQCLQKANKV